MTGKPTIDDLMKAKLAELIAQRDAITAKSHPLREKRKTLMQTVRVEEKALIDEYLEIEKGLFEINNEIGRLAKALGGRAMSDVS
jgi:uncharacterized coiled-coil DUF342 family protein